jgi:hypothetical protein
MLTQMNTDTINEEEVVCWGEDGETVRQETGMRV